MLVPGRPLLNDEVFIKSPRQERERERETEDKYGWADLTVPYAREGGREAEREREGERAPFICTLRS